MMDRKSDGNGSPASSTEGAGRVGTAFGIAERGCLWGHFLIHPDIPVRDA